MSFQKPVAFRAVATGSALLLVMISLAHIAEPTLVARLYALDPSSGTDFAFSRFGALLGGLAYLMWRGRRVVARRAQIAIMGSVALGLLLLALTGTLSLLRGTAGGILPVVIGIELLWAALAILTLRRIEARA